MQHLRDGEQVALLDGKPLFVLNHALHPVAHLLVLLRPLRQLRQREQRPQWHGRGRAAAEGMQTKLSLPLTAPYTLLLIAGLPAVATAATEFARALAYSMSSDMALRAAWPYATVH